MRILFCPSDIGGGFGHISRCRALAEYGKRKKHECTFIFHNKNYADSFASKYKIYYVPVAHVYNNVLKQIFKYFIFRKAVPLPLFVTIRNLNYQVIRDGFTDTKIVKKIIERYKNVIHDFKPDLIVGDTNLIIGIVAKLLKIPMIQLVRAGSYPSNPQLIWWEPIPKDIKSPDIRPIFNPILEHNKLSPIKQAEELLEGNLYLIPSIPHIEPLDSSGNTYYIGPLLRKKQKTTIPHWIRDRNKSYPFIYVTIGGGASTVGNSKFFNTIIDAFRDKNLQIIVSTSSKFTVSGFKNVPTNIHFEQWVPGREIINLADLIIFHGGYGTMMETIEAGKPSIVIPFHSEQESNGRRLEAAGCSLVCKLSETKEQLVKHKWKYGDYTTLIQTSYDLTPKKLNQLTNYILSDHRFVDVSKKLKHECEKYNGPEQVFEIISKNF